MGNIVSARKLYPDGLYDLLFKAGLIGEGEIIVYGHYKSVKADRRGDDNVWREQDVLVDDSTVDKVPMVPILDSNGRILGDWTDGLTKEEIKRIHEEAKVPIFFSGDPVKGDSIVLVGHGTVFQLFDPIQMANYRIIRHNDAIAKNKDERTEDQDFYFYRPEEVREEKKKELNHRKEAIKLIDSLKIEAKSDILNLMIYECGLQLSPTATADDKLLAFAEQCFENSIEVNRINELTDKTRRLVIYEMVANNILVTPQHGFAPPYYRPSTNSRDEFGALIGDSVDEAIRNLSKSENADLRRDHEKVMARLAQRKNSADDFSYDDMDRINKELDEEEDDDMSFAAKYELPEKIDNNWLKNANKAALKTYLVKYEIEFAEDATNKELKELITKHLKEGEDK